MTGTEAHCRCTDGCGPACVIRLQKYECNEKICHSSSCTNRGRFLQGPLKENLEVCLGGRRSRVELVAQRNFNEGDIILAEPEKLVVGYIRENIDDKEPNSLYEAWDDDGTMRYGLFASEEIRKGDYVKVKCHQKEALGLT